MFCIGVTGGIGCGKTTAAQILSVHGLPVIDADAISKTVTAPGGAAIPEIIDRFGPEFIKTDGSLDRGMMAEKVFTDRKLLDLLSLIVHRHVMAEMARQREQFQREKVRACVLDVPVPVKEGFLDVCDQVWVVWADEEIRLKRLRERGMSESEARRRMKIQMSREEYQDLGTKFIENNGSLTELEDKLNALLETEVLQRGIPVKVGRLFES